MPKPIAIAMLLLAAAPLAAQQAQEPERSDVDKVLDGAGNAVERPLKDLGIVKIKAPSDLVAIMERPYDLGNRRSCSALKAEIDRMTGLLGPDVDAVKSDKDSTATEKVVGSMEGLTGGLIPGQGIIREVTGANAAAKRRAAAILAGNLRRAYAKGTARAKGCKV